MNLMIKRCFFSLLSMVVYAIPVLASNIAPLNSLGFQGASDVVESKAFDAPWAGELIFNQQAQMELQPEQNAQIHGKRQVFGLNLGTNLIEGSDLAIGLRYVDESIDISEARSGLGRFTSQQGVNMSLALRQNLLDQQHIQLAIIPYIEPGYGPQNSFSIASKTRLGFILASGLDYRYWDMSTNFGYRYRPVEYFGQYRLSNEYHFSAKMGLKFHPVFLHGEIHERNIFVLSTMNRRPAYYRIVSQHHKIVAALEFDELRYSLFWGRAVHQKTFGVPGQQIGVAVSWNIGQNATSRHHNLKPSEEQLDKRPKDRNELNSPMEEEIPLLPFDAEDDMEPTMDQEEPTLLDPMPFDVPELEQLDRLEERLHQMQLVEGQGVMPTLHESEIVQLQLGETQIQRLNRVNQALEEKEALSQIRRKMHDKQNKSKTVDGQSTVAPSGDTNPALLDQLDERANTDIPSPVTTGATEKNPR